MKRKHLYFHKDRCEAPRPCDNKDCEAILTTGELAGHDCLQYYKNMVKTLKEENLMLRKFSAGDDEIIEDFGCKAIRECRRCRKQYDEKKEKPQHEWVKGACLGRKCQNCDLADNFNDSHYYLIKEGRKWCRICEITTILDEKPAFNNAFFI